MMREIKIKDISIFKEYSQRWSLEFISNEQNLSLADDYEDLILRMYQYGNTNGYFLVKQFDWSEAVKKDRGFRVKGTSNKVRIFEDKDGIIKEEI